MARILGTGFAVPELVITNNDISDSDKWIVENIGINERRSLGMGQSLSLLARGAGIKAIRAAGLDMEDIHMIIVATSTPDTLAPSTACNVNKLLSGKATSFDINAVCCGFIYALAVAESFADHGNILVIGADAFSRITDYSDRNCVFFGDGAGAVVLGKGNNFKGFEIRSDSTDNCGFFCNYGGTFVMDTKLVYETATKLVPEVINDVLHTAGVSIKDVDYMVPHQPSIRILNDVADKIGIPREKVLMNMGSYANTAAATIPILLAENWHRFKKGDKILFAAIGSGWTYGAAIYEV